MTKKKRMNKKIVLSLVVVGTLVWTYFVVRAFRGDIVIPNQIHLGFFSIRFYGLIILAAVFAGATFLEKVMKEYQLAEKGFEKVLKKFDVSEVIIWAVIPGIIFARVFYYFSFIDEYYGGQITEIYKIWNGGLSIFGAAIGGVLGVVLYLRKNKISLFPVIDFLFIALPLGHAIGRWGNFLNKEIFGPPTNLPWKMFVPLENRPFEHFTSEYFHPLFLYEFILNLGVFGFLYFLFKKQPKRFQGFFLSIYIVLYGLIRFFMEFLRFDPTLKFGLSVAQLASLLMILAGGVYFSYKTFVKNA